MNSYLPLAFAALVLVACKKEPVKPPTPEQPVTKTITFQVFAGRDYSHPYYADTRADVVLNIHKVNKQNGAITLVWDTTFTPRPLALYPQRKQGFVVQKSIPVRESEHKLNGNYGIRYNTQGALQQEGHAEDVPAGTQGLLLEVGL